MKSDLKPYYEKTFERHRKDLEDIKNGVKLNLRFNENLANAYIKIIEQLKHYKGVLAGKHLKLESWQKKSIAIAFGWQKLNSQGQWVRRFNTVFFFIPRKNGKTILASAIAIADSIILGETGGEVIIFATKRNQAKLAWAGCENMFLAHNDLKKNCKVAYSTITMLKNNTTFTTLGRDSDTEDGLNATIGIADEYHAHPDNSLWDVIKSSQGARKQPLMLAITTAGFKISSPAYNMYQYAKKVVEGIIEDDNFFAFIAEADKDDDPFDENTWIKANPNYGVPGAIDRDTFAIDAKEAKERPELRNNFIVKRLNKWTTAAETFIPYEDWESCAGEVVSFKNQIVGMDLSIADDFTSTVNIYKKDGLFYIKPRFYIPQKNILERERTLHIPLSSWIEQGYITATPGASIDDSYITNDLIEELAITEAICYDPYKAAVIINEIENEHGYDSCIPIRQGFLTLSNPTKYFLDLVRDKKIVHDNNPVMNWMVSNMSILTDAAGNIKPNKSDLNAKIDGAAALINALAYLVMKKDEIIVNPYKENGFRFL